MLTGLASCGTKSDGLAVPPGDDAAAAGAGGGAGAGGRGGAGGVGGAGGGGAAGSGGTGGAAGDAGSEARPPDAPVPTDSRDGAMPMGMGTWQALAPLSGGPRGEVGVAALNGLVFVVGGLGAGSRRVEAYDPVAGTWQAHTALPIPIDHGNVAAANGKLYLLGGFSMGGATTGATWEYDPVSRAPWVMKQAMPSGTERGASATATIGAKIYIAGGQQGLGSTGQRWFSAYDAAGNTWQPLPDLPAPGRNHLAGVAVGGIFYAVGGRITGVTGGLQNRLDAFDPVAMTWTPKAPMPTPRGGLAAGVVNGIIIAAGGEGADMAMYPTGVFPHVEAYDPGANSWRRLANMATPRHGMGAAGIDGKLYVPAGGARQGGSMPVATLEVFVP